VHTFDGNSRCDLGMIIHNQWCAGWDRDFMDLRREVDQLVDRFSFCAKLNEIDTTGDHLFGDTTAIPHSRDVTEVNDAVKAAVA
jgi:hypothetical protein